MKARVYQEQCCGRMLERGNLGKQVAPRGNAGQITSVLSDSSRHPSLRPGSLPSPSIQSKSGCSSFTLKRDEPLADSVAPERIAKWKAEQAQLPIW